MGDEFNNRGKWEDAWQKAFDDSEHSPSKRVWQGLENSLMEEQLRRYKRKAFLYQWLAAASVVLLGLWAGWWLYASQPLSQQEQLSDTAAIEVAAPTATTSGAASPEATPPGAAITAPLTTAREPESLPAQEQNTLAASELKQPAVAAAGSASASTSVRSAAAVPAAGAAAQQEIGLLQEPQIAAVTEESVQEIIPEIAAQETPASAAAAAQEHLVALEMEQETKQEAAGSLAENRVTAEATLPLYELPDLQLTPFLATLQLPKGEIELPRLPVFVAKKQHKKNNSTRNGNLWLGASVASSFFSPNMNEGNQSLAWVDQPVASGKQANQVYSANVTNWNEKEKSLPSVNFQIDAAWRIGQRWMFQSGIQYGSFKVNTMSGTFTGQDGEKIYPLYYSNFSYDKLQAVSTNSRMSMPVSALNTYNFMSVPLSFSYVLTERIIGVALSAGVTSDVFLGGRIGDMEQRLDEYELEPGTGSPFQRVHFNALLGTKFFYRAGPNYLITLEPSYRHSLTSFNKRSSIFDSKPTQFGVAVGFRFILH